MDAAQFVDARGGVASHLELLDAGVSRRGLTEAVASGQLRRPRRGWYATLATTHPAYRAVRLGGRLTSASALHHLGAWMLNSPIDVEVAVPRGSSRLRSDLGVVVHWLEDHDEPASAAVVGVAAALTRVILDHDLEVSVPCVDWAFATGRLDASRWRRLVRELPAAARCITEWVDPASQSVLESVARTRLLRAGLKLRSQVPVGRSQAIDLVVAEHIALELDGREHHEHSFERDRRKDLRITLEGRHPVRLTYSMLLGDWPSVVDAIEAALRPRGSSIAHISVTPPPEPRGSRRRITRTRAND